MEREGKRRNDRERERERGGKRGKERERGGKTGKGGKDREREGGLITNTICLVSYLLINHEQKNNNKSIAASAHNQIFNTFYGKFEIIRDNCQKTT